jgi:uncharacterized membrane protein
MRSGQLPVGVVVLMLFAIAKVIHGVWDTPRAISQISIGISAVLLAGHRQDITLLCHQLGQGLQLSQHALDVFGHVRSARAGSPSPA